MVKKVGNAQIVTRLTNKFQLTDLEPEILSMQERIVPVTDADDILKRWRLLRTVNSISATGYSTVIAAPAGQRYYLRGVDVELSTGTYTMTKIAIKSLSGYRVDVLIQAAGTKIIWVPPHPDFYLDYGWQVDVYVDAYTGTGNVNCNVLLRSSDAVNE